MNPEIGAILARVSELEATGMDRKTALLTVARERRGIDLGRGNIDLNSRPVVRNPDGSISTVYSHTIGPDSEGKFVLIPGVRPGLDRIMEAGEAADWYEKTGQHLGKFSSIKEAGAYAEALHKQQEKLYK